MSKGLGPGPYVEARVGFDPSELLTQGTELITEPPQCSISIIFSVGPHLCLVTTEDVDTGIEH